MKIKFNPPRVRSSIENLLFSVELFLVNKGYFQLHRFVYSANFLILAGRMEQYLWYSGRIQTVEIKV